jgi:septal ring factor EnvC (AmiA/AmiB activator)|tara:strand:- start:2107 stop:2334 length:228 start_codon:yes stop_codon:yes gene_type:complete
MTLPKFNAESLGFIATILFVLASISASYGVSQHQLNRHEAKLAEVEERINQNENLLIEIANDVRWIREQISRQAQ